MSDQTAYDEDARWLLSDGNIIGKVHRKPDPQGIRLMLDMPFGEPVVAVVEKLNAAAMSTFCEIARGAYGERKAEQAAQAERGSRANEERKQAEREEAVQDTETSVVVDPLDPESIRARISELLAREQRLVDDLAAVVKERNKWTSIWRVVYDAPNDDEATNGSLQTTTPSPNEGEGAVSTVDLPTCEDQLLQSGEGCTVETDSGLEPLPDAEPKARKDRSLQEEANVNSGSVECGDSNPDAL